MSAQGVMQGAELTTIRGISLEGQGGENIMTNSNDLRSVGEEIRWRLQSQGLEI